MTPTRPIHPPFLAILAQLAERGPLHSRTLKPFAVNASASLSYMVEATWIASERVTVPPLNRYTYHITDAGRSALESGVVERKSCKPKTIRLFTATAPPRTAPVARTGCIHHWKIESTYHQPGTCLKCGEAKDFAPTFGAELGKVGGGRVQKSDRYQG